MEIREYFHLDLLIMSKVSSIFLWYSTRSVLLFKFSTYVG